MVEFQNEYQDANQQFALYKKQSNLIAIIRFVSMISAIILLLIGYFYKMSFLYIIALIFFVAFMGLVMYHERLKEKVRYYQSLSHVYLTHIQRQNDEWKDFDNDGHEFIDMNQELSYDLDIFGKNSLFQMINVAFTQKGQKTLASCLMDPKVENIENYQEAVKELSTMSDFIIQMETHGEFISHFQENHIDDLIHMKSHHQKKNPYIYILPVITCIALVLTLLQIGTPYTYIICEVGFVMQLCLAIITLKRHTDYFQPITRFDKGLQSYLALFRVIKETEFHSNILKDMKDTLFIKSDVILGIEKLSQISQKVMYRQNIFAFLLLNGFLSFDLLISNQYTSWLDEYHFNVEHWFDKLALLEAFMSLSIPKIDSENVSIPYITSKNLELSFQNLRHPLILKDKVVGNDFSVEKSVTIITGSNMSGKTTFMRSIALNLILAYAGGFVYADEMTCSFMHIMTSMRVKDNVEEGISTFYGELLRIKEMVQYTQNKEPMICFIDEIFKGTNSLDRIAGAKATIQKLSLPYCFAFLTTHDFELCQIDQVECQNYHFDEYYQDEHIYFDYQIKKGQSQSTNGQFLLRQLGIMEGGNHHV